MCVKLDTNQKQILCENQQLNLENQALLRKNLWTKGKPYRIWIGLTVEKQRTQKVEIDKKDKWDTSTGESIVKVKYNFHKKGTFP
jgi:hypothetical protein